jgi:Molybdate transporter of MFS superfamily
LTIVLYASLPFTRIFVSLSDTTLLQMKSKTGSCGDLGTFIPLFVAMGRGDQRSIHVAPALFFAGMSNAVTGYVWDLPLPVQPMKTICAVALVGELDQIQVTTAGVWMVRDGASDPHNVSRALV